MNVKIHRGLNTPMPSQERKMRERIIKKAEYMAADLVTIFHAGLLPNNKHKENKSASALCHSISLGISIQALEPDFLKEYDSDNNPVTKEVT